MGNPETAIPILLGIAWLLPLASFTIILFWGRMLGRAAALVATSAIVSGFVLSLIALVGFWLPSHPLSSGHDDHISGGGLRVEGGGHALTRTAHHSLFTTHHSPPTTSGRGSRVEGLGHALTRTTTYSPPTTHHDDHHHAAPAYYAGDWYSLVEIGQLKLSIGYYIDSLTVAMFCMVTLIASCIHFYAMGYMHEELHPVTDHEVTLSNGDHLTRPGRFYRFFQYLSLFCFSMLGIVYAGNVAMVFIFWELVGICSYFLIGFYIERKSASTAANKAFIVNRVGDFGMIIGLMALFGSLGTFNFGDTVDETGQTQAGIFSLIRPAENHHRLQTPEAMVLASARDQQAAIRGSHLGEPQAADAVDAQLNNQLDTWREQGYGYWLLVIAGLGIFCGCVGKSAQFPLHTWLPDAMEGPTPVSALVHSATMVAAGVYLVARFFPAFAPEVLLTIAYVGLITLFLAATIAITATDIKRVLAYSTVSQLGYMMLALGVGGWLAGVFHLFTHAFFKSLLFMCSGSVIHAVHTNEMTEMGGLRHKMPWTAYTMLVGCLAIIGAGIPFVIGFSGYYSKDAILEQALNFTNHNPVHAILFYGAAGGAAITAFYMFRLWYMTFAGEPRNQHRYDHAHESPKVMYYPLVVLSVFAIGVGWSVGGLSLTGLLEQARPAGTLPTVEGGLLLGDLVIPNEHDSHLPAVKTPATWIAFSTAMAGLLLATVIYCWRKVDAEEIRSQFRAVHRFLVNKWWFDELYDAIFVQPTHFVARRASQVDKSVLDGLIDGSAKVVRWCSRILDGVLDRTVVDGSINLFARKTWGLGLSLRNVQTGQLRQYVMLIVVGTVALFALVSFFWSIALAG